MKKITFLFSLVLLSCYSSFGQEANPKVPTPNYRLASKFSPTNIGKLVHSTFVKPNWLKNGNRFWYQYKTTEGSNYYIVDPDKRTKTKLFDNAKMAKWLSEFTKDSYDAKHLPYFSFKFVKNETAIRFKVTSKERVEVIEEKKEIVKTDTIATKQNSTLVKKARKRAPKMKNKVYHFEYKLGGNGLTVINNKKEKKKKRASWANVSPDSTIVLFSKNYNLYWMDKENFLKAVKDKKDSTIVENKWTQDGVEHFGYGGRNSDKKDDRTKIKGIWSHDSKKFVFQKTDSRHIKDLWVINSVSSGRPTLQTYKYHMPGEEEYFKSEIHVFDTSSKDVNKIKLDTTVQQDVTIYRAPRKQSNQSDEFRPWLLLSNKGKIYFSTKSRDKKKINICVADINTGDVKILIKEELNTYVDNIPLVLLNDEQELLHWSERDGWAHFYLYDNNGKLKRQVTSGEYHVDKYVNFDEKERVLYFTANGVTKNQDPYYEHLFRINLNGTGLKNINPGNYNTFINMSDSNKYFVSNYSRVNTVPKSELRNSSGKVVMNLEEADLSQLMATGYKFPEPFKTKADDGITDIYGVMYKPFDFDETKSYPLLEYVYPGPQTEDVNKSFSVEMDKLDRMAQVGFIVVTLGNRGGHPNRSKWYHNYGYGNFRDYGLADKKYVAEQLANQHPYIDINKVGIYGHSGGGFMSTAAMLVYPDFFKVAVSSSGNHDNSMYTSLWSEKYHGIQEEKDAYGNSRYKFAIEKNQSLAGNLKGKLMLVTGDEDSNVHPGATIRMANALIKANKRFDFMLMPGKHHSFGNMTEYFFWLKADYFSKHFLNNKALSADITEMNRDKPKKR